MGTEICGGRGGSTVINKTQGTKIRMRRFAEVCGGTVGTKEGVKLLLLIKSQGANLASDVCGGLWRFAEGQPECGSTCGTVRPKLWDS